MLLDKPGKAVVQFRILTGQIEKFQACLGQFDFPFSLGPHHQLYTHGFFQLVKAGRDRRLGVVEGGYGFGNGCYETVDSVYSYPNLRYSDGYGDLCAHRTTRKKRLIAEGILKENAPLNMDEFISQLTEEQLQMRRPKLIWVNWILIVAVIAMLISSIVKPVIAFMIGTAVVLIINYHDPAAQRKLLEDTGKDAIGLTCIIFAAGVLMGIMGKSGMSAAMATTLVSLLPTAIGKFMTPIIGVLTIPLSILFDADSYYYGILPILIETAEAMGTSGVDIARASMIGQMTVGWPTSPMVGTFFLFTGLLDLDIGTWQKYCLKYFILLTVAMTAFACLTGLFAL